VILLAFASDGGTAGLSGFPGELLFDIVVIVPWVAIICGIVYLIRRRRRYRIPKSQRRWVYVDLPKIHQHPTGHENYSGTPPPRHFGDFGN
jgi:hypothetical protein